MTVVTLERRADRAEPEPEVQGGEIQESAVALSGLEAMISGALGTSVLEVEQFMVHLERMRDHLQKEAERVQWEIAQYAQMSQAATEMTKIMIESLSRWKNGVSP